MLVWVDGEASGSIGRSRSVEVCVKNIFRGRMPTWLVRFSHEPDVALRDLFMRRASLGNLDRAEPVELLSDWIDGIGDGFATLLDQSLARWINQIAEWATEIRYLLDRYPQLTKSREAYDHLQRGK
jgi:hypothetical protein